MSSNIRLNTMMLSLVALSAGGLTGPAWGQPGDDEERSGEGGRRDRGGFFSRLDSNDDGELDDTEISEAPEFLRPQLEAALLNGPVTEDVFRESMPRRDRGRNRPENESGEPGRVERPGTPAPAGNGAPAANGAPAQPKPRVSLFLPENYREFDKNQDNQIGLSEWDRARRSEFISLDRDGDGFLTARELTAPPPRTNKSVLIVGQPGGARPLPVAPQTPAGNGPPATTPAAKTPVVIAVPGDFPTRNNEEPAAREARYTFTLMDNNKNEQIDPDEWKRSRKVRPLFERAGLPGETPMSEETFADLYVRAKEFERTEQAGQR